MAFAGAPTRPEGTAGSRNAGPLIPPGPHTLAGPVPLRLKENTRDSAARSMMVTPVPIYLSGGKSSPPQRWVLHRVYQPGWRRRANPNRNLPLAGSRGSLINFMKTLNNYYYTADKGGLKDAGRYYARPQGIRHTGVGTPTSPRRRRRPNLAANPGTGRGCSGCLVAPPRRPLDIRGLVY